MLITLKGLCNRYGVHSVPKPFNILIYLADKINQFSVFNKITL